MSDAACDWPWSIHLELSVVYSLLLASSAGLAYVKNEPGCIPRPVLARNRPSEKSAEVLNSLRSQLVFKLISYIAPDFTQQPWLSSTSWGRVIPVGRTIASPQAEATWRGVLCLRMIASALWAMTQHRDPGHSFFILSPERLAPDFPHVSIVHSALPLLEPKISCCKWNFVYWSFRWFSASQVISLADRNPAAFHSHVLLGFLSRSWCYRLGRLAWGLNSTPLRQNLPSADISFWHFSCHP